jgi:hypothetical protein
METGNGFRYLQLSHEPMSLPFAYEDMYSGRKITESLGNVTKTGEKRWKEQEWSAIVNSLSEHV